MLTLPFRVAFLLLIALGFVEKCCAATFSSPPDTTTFWDEARSRPVPIARYLPEQPQKNKPLVILSHGYAENDPNAYLSYQYLATFLAAKGFEVVSIQHELPTDSLLPTSGKPQMVRLPFWQRGVENIHFVIKTLRQRQWLNPLQPVVLIGHSNGGDISALFPRIYPDQIQKIITLDNRRMALPRDRQLPVLSLRSSDQPSDDGVLPSVEEQKQFPIQWVKLSNTRHNDMSDQGDDSQKAEIQALILKFLAQ